jgi:hypothetical protein
MSTTVEVIVIVAAVIVGIAIICTLIMLPELRRYMRIRKM